MASTSAFGWETPDDTDLVKDGAAAIRTLGNSIDTSMADLKGGTSGQVLSKASNTDMDFTWVTSDDANAIQNAIVDAKGDLIAATAADTPARLAVGANNYVLMADSTAATGLKYGGDWTTYTPTLTNLTIGNGTVSARYQQIGKLVNVFVRIGLGSTSSVGTSPSFTLPTNVQTNGVQGFAGYDRFGVGAGPLGFILSASNVCYPLSLNAGGSFLAYNTMTATNPFTWGTNDAMFFQFSYEAA